MSINHLTPIILLATANDYQDGKRAAQLSHEKKMISNLFKVESAQTLYYIIDENPKKGAFIFDIFRQHAFSPEVSILHITGFSMGEKLHFQGGFGEEVLTADEFGSQVAKFPNLKLVFMNGCATNEILETLVSRDIPAVIVTQVDHDRKFAAAISKTFYTGIARGLSVNQAIERITEKYSDKFGVHKVSYDLESDTFTWPEKSNTKEDKLSWGAYVMEDHRADRDWKLPVLLPRAEEEIEESEKKRFRLLPWLGVFVLLAGLITGGVLWEDISSTFFSSSSEPENTCLFQHAGTYNILQLPLHELENCDASDPYFIGTVSRRLSKLEDDGPGFEVQQLNNAACPANFEEAESMIRSCNADMVLWGDYTIPTDEAVRFNFQFLYKSEPGKVTHGKYELDMEMFLFEKGSDFMTSAVEDVVFWARGNGHLSRKEYKEAAKYFSRMRKRAEKDYIKVAENLAECYKNLEDYHMARDEYDHILSIDPENYEMYNQRGLIFSQLKDYENALLDFNDATRINPDYAEAYFNRSILYLNIDKYTKALEDADVGQKLKPKEEELYYGVLAAIYAAQREEDLFYSNLELALQNGAKVENIMSYTAAFKQYRNQPAFQKLVEKYQ